MLCFYNMLINYDLFFMYLLLWLVFNAKIRISQRITNKSRKNLHGLGAWAEAKNRSSACLKAELSRMRLTAGRGVQRSVCLRNEGTPCLEDHLLREAVGRPLFLALIFCLLF